MRRVIYIILLLGIVLVDRLTKIFVIRGWHWEFGIFQLERFDNHGLIFSIPISPVVAIILMSVVVVTIGWWVFSRRKKIPPVIIFAVGCVLVGAMSNLLDRILYGVEIGRAHV